MDNVEIPTQLFMCPQCKTKLINESQKIFCPSCNKEVLRNGRMLDFNQLTPKLNFKFVDYLSELYNLAGQKQNDISDDWRIKKILRNLPKKGNGSFCLEIGGADGPLTPSLEKLYSYVYSIDLSKAFLRRIELKTKKTLCLYGDAQFLPFSDKSIDVIICSEVLEHVLIPTQLLLEIKRVLKSDGCCILSVPNETDGFLSGLSKTNQVTATDGHINFYTPTNLKKLLFRMGFEVEDLQKIGAPFTLKRLLFVPGMILINGSIYSHILCTIQTLDKPEQYWTSLEERIKLEHPKFEDPF